MKNVNTTNVKMVATSRLIINFKYYQGIEKCQAELIDASSKEESVSYERYDDYIWEIERQREIIDIIGNELKRRISIPTEGEDSPSVMQIVAIQALVNKIQER